MAGKTNGSYECNVAINKSGVHIKLIMICHENEYCKSTIF